MQNQLTVFPNPFQDEFVIETSSNQKLDFRLFDSFGRTSTPLSMPKLNAIKTEIGYRILVGDIPKGIYLLQVSDGKEQASFKLIKE